MPFDITIEDLIVPAVCPALGIPLKRSRVTANDGSPSVDRIVPELGYVKGNVVVISNLANRIKTNASWQQIQAVATWLKGVSAKAAD